jgi:adenine-specific DNA-methyltransferase
MSPSLPAAQRKALGAFYTVEPVARFLVRWGLRAPGEAVLDPSCGDGRFLELARELGAGQLVGCDVSPQALVAAAERLRAGGTTAELRGADFFSVEPFDLEPVDLVVGNPPFIRYQRFNGESRRRALRSALRAGVRLTRLTSSWAPFVLHALQFLKPGGRLAMVVPAEIASTHYGLRTLRGLLGHFAEIHLLAFERNFFEEAQEETHLLLADGCGSACATVRMVPLESIEALAGFELGGAEPAAGLAVEMAGEPESLVRFAEAFLSGEGRRAWRRIKRHPQVRSVGSLAVVTNGYVTGDNGFFHRTSQEAARQDLPQTWLLPTARSSRSLLGLRFTSQDVSELEERGAAHHLVAPEDDLFSAADRRVMERFVADGQARGTPQRFKCRTRDPWWKVPGLQRADVLVGYMAGAYPRAAENRAGAFFTNSLHGLRLHDPAAAPLLALGLYSSLGLLSLEIEGRSYGGGILKVEPRELDRVLVPWPTLPLRDLQRLAEAVDPLLRQGRFEAANEAVDRALLVAGLGLSPRAVRDLRSARQRLLQRRLGRRAEGGAARRKRE